MLLELKLGRCRGKQVHCTGGQEQEHCIEEQGIEEQEQEHCIELGLEQEHYTGGQEQERCTGGQEQERCTGGQEHCTVEQEQEQQEHYTAPCQVNCIW